MLKGHAFWTKKRRDNISESDGDVVPQHDAQRDRGVYGRHDSKVLRRRWSRNQYEKVVRTTEEVPVEA